MYKKSDVVTAPNTYTGEPYWKPNPEAPMEIPFRTASIETSKPPFLSLTLQKHFKRVNGNIKPFVMDYTDTGARWNQCNELYAEDDLNRLKDALIQLAEEHSL